MSINPFLTPTTANSHHVLIPVLPPKPGDTSCLEERSPYIKFSTSSFSRPETAPTTQMPVNDASSFCKASRTGGRVKPNK